MAQRYWDPELEAMPWDEVLAWQAARAAPFVRALTARSEFHRALLGTGPAVDAAAGLKFLAGLPFTTKDDMRRSQAEGRPGEPYGRTRACHCPRWSRPCPPQALPVSPSCTR